MRSVRAAATHHHTSLRGERRVSGLPPPHTGLPRGPRAAKCAISSRSTAGHRFPAISRLITSGPRGRRMTLAGLAARACAVRPGAEGRYRVARPLVPNAARRRRRSVEMVPRGREARRNHWTSTLRSCPQDLPDNDPAYCCQGLFRPKRCMGGSGLRTLLRPPLHGSAPVNRMPSTSPHDRAAPRHRTTGRRGVR